MIEFANFGNDFPLPTLFSIAFLFMLFIRARPCSRARHAFDAAK
jgi:hypothetical protein